MPQFTLTALKWIPMEKLTPQEENLKVRPVVKDENFAALVENVKSKGMIDPLTVIPAKSPPGVYVVLGGNRRFEACKVAFAGRKNVELPCVVGPEGMSALDQLTIGTDENLIRENLTPTQVYDVARRLRKMGITKQSKQAQALGISETYLSQLLSAGRSGRIQRGGPVVVRKGSTGDVKRTETFSGHCPKCKARLQVKREWDDKEKAYSWEIAPA